MDDSDGLLSLYLEAIRGNDSTNLASLMETNPIHPSQHIMTDLDPNVVPRSRSRLFEEMMNPSRDIDILAICVKIEGFGGEEVNYYLNYFRGENADCKKYFQFLLLMLKNFNAEELRAFRCEDGETLLIKFCYLNNISPETYNKEIQEVIMFMIEDIKIDPTFCPIDPKTAKPTHSIMPYAVCDRLTHVVKHLIEKFRMNPNEKLSGRNPLKFAIDECLSFDLKRTEDCDHITRLAEHIRYIKSTKFIFDTQTIQSLQKLISLIKDHPEFFRDHVRSLEEICGK